MKIDKATMGIGLAAITVMAASLLVLVVDYRSEVENHRAVLLARGETALDALTAGIRAQGRMGRYRGDRLSYIFEELAAAPGITGVALVGADHGIIASGGDTALLIGAGTGAGWESTALVLSRDVALETGGHGPGQGQGRGAQRWEAEGFEALSPGPHRLAIALDTESMYSEMSADVARSMIAFGVVVVLVLVGGFATEGWLRRRSLQAALNASREQTERQEHLALLGAGLAHETKNPLSVVRGHAQLIAESPEDREENRARAERIVDEIDRAVGHINGFLSLSRPRELEIGPLALQPFLEAFVALMEEEGRQKGVAIAFDSGDITVRADGGQLRKALLNLVLNALAACAPGDQIDIAVTSSNGKVALTVRDSGRGIAPEDLARVTEPYFSRSEKGCGVGLALVRQIADGHGWTLDIQSTLGEGTTVSLCGLESVS
jgi:two-component system sensor histidine kinase HydH